MMPRAEPRRITALDIFDRARAEAIPLIAVPAGSPLTAVQASGLARARMAVVEPGRLLVAPGRTPAASPSHFAWWQLDPSTGEAVSVLDTGLNGAQELRECGDERDLAGGLRGGPAQLGSDITDGVRGRRAPGAMRDLRRRHAPGGARGDHGHGRVRRAALVSGDEAGLSACLPAGALRAGPHYGCSEGHGRCDSPSRKKTLSSALLTGVRHHEAACLVEFPKDGPIGDHRSNLLDRPQFVP
jgi:hypothetical protein